tara:strand:- start:259 stop:777 length:519 start_codon:yes stop_codon:yes gene_type:complete
MNTELRELIVNQINKELFAFYQYKSIYTYLKNENIALDNLANYFLKASNEENDHAMLLINYLIKRGESINYKSIDEPIVDFSRETLLKDILFIFEKSLELENNIYDHLLIISKKSDELNEYHLHDYITNHFLSEQTDARHELTKYITTIRGLQTDSSPYLSALYFNDKFKDI